MIRLPFRHIILKFAVGIAEFLLKPCRTWAREENLTCFSFHLMGENMGKMDFACWSRCINGLKTKSNAFERILALELRFLGLFAGFFASKCKMLNKY